MNFRTDLALEISEAEGKINGIESHEESCGNTKITRIDITTAEGERRMNRKIGKYITIELQNFSRNDSFGDEETEIAAREIASLLPKSGTVLIAGLGNEQITPDALGPKCANLIFSTRHIDDELKKSIGFASLRSVARVVPGVLGQNGIETGEIIASIVKQISPAALITVDALASRRLARLGCTVQICNTGITPGSGVGNARKEISERTMGIPVIAIGVPTVVDASTLARDLTGEKPKGEMQGYGDKMMVTSREIDTVIDRASRFVAFAINKALQPDIELSELYALMA